MDLLIMRGNDLYHAFLTGAKKLISKKNHLNQINVFPVADGDTGTNLSYLMQTIINQAKPSENLSDTIESIANAAITGSRGNSGIILSEYFMGLAEKLKGKVEVKLEEFKEAISHAVQKSYSALLNPIEGTILTVIRKAFDSSMTSKDFKAYFQTSFEAAKIALQETKEQLEVLKKNGVVDAGAEGFTAFLEGINYYMQTGISDVVYIQDDVVQIEESHSEEITERYCTEALLMHVNRSKDDLKTIFKEYGSSLIISGKSEKMRLHIHTDHPDLFFAQLRQYGKILEQKVDDMLRQVQAIESKHPRVAIVTDSIADLPASLRDEYQVHLIPTLLLIDDVSYLDKVTISENTFYDLLKTSNQLSSAQPDRFSIERSFDFLNQHYDEIIVISVASKLSGTFQAFMQSAKLYPKIKVFDSKQNSGAEGLVVLEAAKKAKQGWSQAEILAHLETFTNRTKIYVSVKTLKYMVKMGRLSKVGGLVAKIINLKPVVSLDEEGKGVIAAKAFSLGQNVRKIMKLIAKGEIESYAIVHANSLPRAEKMASKIKLKTGIDPLYITEISPIVAMNAGIGAVAVALTFKEEKA